MSLIKEILSDKELLSKPPVLIDIGASGNIHSKWKMFAAYSICVAFDADEREFGFVTKAASGYLKLHVFNCIVTDKEEETVPFYLTKSPYCSSILKPRGDKLTNWAFADKFEIETETLLKNISLSGSLKKTGIEYVDWFKTDSQGIDLRLFNNLRPDIIKNVLVAEFEPGIIDSYEGEDKLYSLFQYMENKPFWLADITVKGSERIRRETLDSLSKNAFIKKLVHFSMKSSPGWAETLYLNDFSEIKERRQFLLGWIFSTINSQHGFALFLANKGFELFNEKIFKRMVLHSRRNIYLNLLKFKFLPSVFIKFKKMFNQD